ncbi:MAG: DUF2333 family protein [Gammaproteobacteria bacterium]
MNTEASPEAVARARALGRGGGLTIAVSAVIVLVLIVLAVVSFYWSRDPALFDVRENASRFAAAQERPVVTGTTMTATLVRVTETLLEKPGGYLSNDIAPPGALLDNMPNWEFGALVQVRDLSKAMRETLARSQSQSKEDPDLALAEPQFNYDNSSWILPSSEDEYRTGIRKLRAYGKRLADPQNPDAQFYARADNLRYWLGTVESRLGSLSQRLSASVARSRLNTDLAGDPAAQQATTAPQEFDARTPWLEIDDIFYEARGSSWALIHFLRAAEVEFGDVLDKKNATVSLRQIIRELEGTQEPMWSPVVLNGTGFGLVANHSLVMASYISRANAALIDLRELLARG